MSVFAVAPHAGAWIEIGLQTPRAAPLQVAPHAGAWIEMAHVLGCSIEELVAPHAGAWIEIAWADRHISVLRKI